MKLALLKFSLAVPATRGFTRRGETQVGSRDLTFEVEVYEASEAELQLKTSVSLRTESGGCYP